jgi:hypothetical protein
MLKSVTLLTRDAGVLARAHESLRALFPLSPYCWPASGEIGEAGAFSVGVCVYPRCGFVLELLHLPSSQKFRWDDRSHSKKDLKLTTANLVSSTVGRTEHAMDLGLACLLGQQPSGVFSFFTTVHPECRITLDGGAVSGSSYAPPALPHSGVEVVLGSTNKEALAENLAAAQLSLRRHESISSVYRSACGSALRILPSRYSAVKLQHYNLGELQERVSALGGKSELYGERGGVAGSGELRVSLPSCEGLDLRFSSEPEVCSFFNETQDSMLDDVDPSLNPDAQSLERSASLGCTSIAGMEVRSTILLKLKGYVSR